MAKLNSTTINGKLVVVSSSGNTGMIVGTTSNNVSTTMNGDLYVSGDAKINGKINSVTIINGVVKASSVTAGDIYTNNIGSSSATVNKEYINTIYAYSAIGSASTRVPKIYSDKLYSYTAIGSSSTLVPEIYADKIYSYSVIGSSDTKVPAIYATNIYGSVNGSVVGGASIGSDTNRVIDIYSMSANISNDLTVGSLTSGGSIHSDSVYTNTIYANTAIGSSSAAVPEIHATNIYGSVVGGASIGSTANRVIEIYSMSANISNDLTVGSISSNSIKANTVTTNELNSKLNLIYNSSDFKNEFTSSSRVTTSFADYTSTVLYINSSSINGNVKI